MPPKAKLQAPIDRPLSRAYQREFSGWSTAYPPGVSEPTSQRILENMMVNRDGTLRLRPAKKYLSFETPPVERVEESKPYPGDPVFVSSRMASGPLSNGTMALPDPSVNGPVQVNDLVVLVIYGGHGACTDPRMEYLGVMRPADGVPGSEGGAYYRDARVYIGHATHLGPISGISQDDGQRDMAVYRGVDGVKLQYVKSAMNWVPVSSSIDQVVPGFDDPNLSGALWIFVGNGGTGGVYGDQNWPLKTPAYTVNHAGDLSYTETDFAVTGQVPVPAQTTPQQDPGDAWSSLIIGLKISPTNPNSTAEIKPETTSTKYNPRRVWADDGGYGVEFWDPATTAGYLHVVFWDAKYTMGPDGKGQRLHHAFPVNVGDSSFYWPQAAPLAGLKGAAMQWSATADIESTDFGDPGSTNLYNNVGPSGPWGKTKPSVDLYWFGPKQYDDATTEDTPWKTKVENRKLIQPVAAKWTYVGNAPDHTYDLDIALTDVVESGVPVSVYILTRGAGAAGVPDSYSQEYIGTTTASGVPLSTYARTPAHPAMQDGVQWLKFRKVRYDGGNSTVAGIGIVVENARTGEPNVTIGDSQRLTDNGPGTTIRSHYYFGEQVNTSSTDPWWIPVGPADGSLVVFPEEEIPDEDTPAGGTAYGRRFVGTHEPFYLNDGRKAYLCAVREEDLTVGFRVLLFDDNASSMFLLQDPIVDFDIPQTETVLNFSEDTTYVKYLQIDNKIFALSDNGEAMRVFYVGEEKIAKALNEITVPSWETTDKLDVMHPEAAWINARTPSASYSNWVPNPSFETGLHGWYPGVNNTSTKLTRPQNLPIAAVSGSRVMRIESKPARTNLATHSLHNVSATGIAGWVGSTGSPTLIANGDWLDILPNGKGNFFARTLKLAGIEAGKKYQFAFDKDDGAHVNVKARVTFYKQNGDVAGEMKQFDVADSTTRSVFAMTAPKNAVSVTLAIGGENTTSGATRVKVRRVMVCLESESTAFFHGGSGANYFWTGIPGASTSVYHPPADVVVRTAKLPAAAKTALTSSLYVAAGSTARTVTLRQRLYNKDGKWLETESATLLETVGSFQRVVVSDAETIAKTAKAEIHLTIPNVARGEYHYVDAAMMQRRATAHDYFDGSTPKETLADYSWSGVKHNSRSVQKTYDAYEGLPTPETMTADTLRATGGAAANPYQFGFFYTFENEVGESAASRITTRRAKRAWSEWLWKKPDADGNPTGADTDVPEAAADQLVALMPEHVFDQALEEGATGWALYMFTWSDQDIVPVTGIKVAERELSPESVYADDGWLRVTPQQVDVAEDMALPTENNRQNFSAPSTAGQGLVAADRMILVNDPNAAGVIRWSSNRMGEYTNFTSRIGGGYKTLVSGNLYVPAACVLWQNPQSADTLTILCMGTDGRSVSYYMAPAQITSQTDTTQIMGFEETTATPGTTSPYGVEVHNNALWHPLDEGLMKSTASNYNINHKMVTDQIVDKWVGLADKYWIMSSQLDNRLYYLVHNPEGEVLEDDCKGNELWVFDTASEAGSWSRFLIQGHALRKIEYGNKVYMSVVHPEGVFFLDPDDWLDDYVNSETLEIQQKPISFRMETNTQGANRAHDAWAHLQQATLTLGNFAGALRWGVRGFDNNGKPVEVEKITRNTKLYAYDFNQLPWDQDDHLRIARQMKEWFFFAESVDDDTEFRGQLSAVQYRYTPISVNVGYDYGSVETFEYARDVAGAASTVTENGVPIPMVDTRRP